MWTLIRTGSRIGLASLVLGALLLLSAGSGVSRASGVTATPTVVTVPISVGNAGQVKAVARLGEGTVNSVAWSPDGSNLAVAGSLGVRVYEIDSLDALPSALG